MSLFSSRKQVAKSVEHKITEIEYEDMEDDYEAPTLAASLTSHSVTLNAAIASELTTPKIQEVKEDWAAKLSHPDCSEMWMKLESKITPSRKENFEAVSKDGRDYFRLAFRAFSTIKKEWNEIDYEEVNREQALVMLHLLYEELPQAINQFRSLLISKGTREAWWGHYSFEIKGIKKEGAVSSVLATIYEKLARISESQNEAKLASLLTSKNEKQALEVKQLPVTTASIDPEIKEKLTELDIVWQLAWKIKTSPEDERFLKEVAETTIPGMCKLYQTFENTTPEVKKSGKSIFLNQIQLIKTQVDAITEACTEANLEAMRQQFAFLQEKANAENPPPTKLELQFGDPVAPNVKTSWM